MSEQVKAAIITAVATIIAALIGLIVAASGSEFSFLVTLVVTLAVGGILGILIGFGLARQRLITIDERGHRTRPYLVRGVNDDHWLAGAIGSLLVFAGCLTLASAIALAIFRLPHTRIVINCPPGETIINILQNGPGVIEGSTYLVEPVPIDELIEGSEGSYYIVDLRSATDQKAWRFSLGNYVIDSFDRDFSGSIVAFVHDIIKPLEGKAEYRLFVRGSADRDLGEDFRSRQVEPYIYRSVEYFPAHGMDRYLSRVKVREIPESFTNRDLPYLRAAFMQEKLGVRSYGLRLPTILEGVVVEQYSEKSRNATVFLFIKWHNEETGKRDA